jgi:hypothetical protein
MWAHRRDSPSGSRLSCRGSSGARTGRTWHCSNVVWRATPLNQHRSLLELQQSSADPRQIKQVSQAPARSDQIAMLVVNLPKEKVLAEADARRTVSGGGGTERNAPVQETAACFSNVGPASLSAHAGASERSATSPDDCIKQVVCDAVIEEGRRSRKPSPCHVFLPFSEPI